MVKNCVNCGKDIGDEAYIVDSDGDFYCSDCFSAAGQSGVLNPPPSAKADPPTRPQTLVYSNGHETSEKPKKANVIGVLSFIFSLLGVFCGVTAPIGLVLGFIGLQRQPRGFALAGIIIGSLVTVLAILLLTFTAIKSKQEFANRVQCAANLRGLLQSMTIYAQSYDEVFPCVPGPSGDTYHNQPQNPMGWTSRQSSAAVSSEWFSAANAPNYGDPLASLWLLVLGDQNMPRDFICPSDPIANAPSLAYTISPDATHPGYYFGNFGSMAEDDGMPNATGMGESYSIAYPWARNNPATTTAPSTTGGWWINDTRADVAIISDMAPQSEVGSGRFQRDTTVPLRDNTYGPYIFNSGNHGGDGQNVGFADIRVEWTANPYVGEQGENIFTYSNTNPFNPSAIGVPMTQTRVAKSPIKIGDQPLESPYGTTMVPVRNVQTGAW